MTFSSSVNSSNEDKIINRFMEVYDTPNDIKELFELLLPKNSLLKTLMDLNSITDKKQLCKILFQYLGENFLHTVGRLPTDDETKGDDGKYIIRENLLERICKKHHNYDEKKQEILDEFNKKHSINYKDFHKMVRDSYFLNKWALTLTEKILELPPITAEKPYIEKPPAETTPLRKRSVLKRLYDYQTQAVIKINEMLSQKEKEKRILINVPTGAGKTRLTVEALVDWLNLRDQKKIPNAHEQQNNGRIIFWFASTNELCTQAADEFEYIYSQIGSAGLLNLTRLYGEGRRKLTDILDDQPGTHIVITNTDHFEGFLTSERGEGTRIIDKYENSSYFKLIRGQTIAIVIDEAHEVTSATYQDFLNAMGFDFSGRIESLNNINRSNIVLIGLTATAYKGSGFKKSWTCVSCNKILNSTEERKKHTNLNRLHINFTTLDEKDPFLKLDAQNDPDYYNKLDAPTKKIHKTFSKIYVPIPQLGHKNSKPSAIIDAPLFAYENEYVKISGLNSFDNNSDIEFLWEIKEFGQPIKKKIESVFYHQFEHPGNYIIKLRVINQNGIDDEKDHKIQIDSAQKSQKIRIGDLGDNKEFYEILERRQILCEIIHGVIDGPQLCFDKQEVNRWKLGRLSGENEERINNALEYNRHVCEIVHKCVKKYKKERVLIFASSVKHSQELTLVLAVKYNLKVKSIDGNTNPGLRRKIVKEYKDGDLEVLCNFGVLTTGFDVPKIDVLIICRDVGSNALYTQMIGRGQRGLVAGGTKDVWLITSFFPKPDVEESELKLGWEVLAENWKKFPEDIKDDLKVKDDIVFSDGIKIETPEIKIEPKNPQIINYNPIEFKCITCNAVGKGYENLVKFFGVDSNEQIINNSLKDGNFPKNCFNCRTLRDIAKSTKCGFCESFLKHHNYDPVFIITANYANNSQIKKETHNFKNLQGTLFDTFKKNIKYSYFDINNPTIQRMEKLGLLIIKNNLEIEFKEIIELSTLEKLIESSYQAEETKKNVDEIIDKYKNTESIVIESDILRNLYDELKKSHGHIPTKRQFDFAVREKEEWWKEFNEKFNASYETLLNMYNEIIKDDEKLKDVLYDEYFEKCMSVRGKITREQLDKHGKYKTNDYEEIFGPFDSFQEKLQLDLKNVLDNYVQKKKEIDKEFEEICKDLKYIKKILGKWPNFEEIRIHSRIGIYRYIIQIKISLLHYLEYYHGENIGYFLRLSKEFFRLQQILLMIPTKQQFIRLTLPVVTEYLGVVFDFKYDKFLKTINIVPPSSIIDPDHIAKMQEKTINSLKEIEPKYGKEKIINFIEFAQNRFDKLSISINAWFEDKKSLKDRFSGTN